MSMVSRHAKVKKPATKSSPVSQSPAHQPVELGRQDVPSDMGRTRSGIHHSPEVWGDRVFCAGDRKHKNAKPS